MAKIYEEIRIGMEYRPCLIDDECKALFHKWESGVKRIPAGPENGWKGGGTVCSDLAIVEDADGRIREVEPNRIRFTDELVPRYFYPEDYGAESTE